MSSAIFGLGMDLIETVRIQQSIERFGDRFLNRIFHESEISYCQRMKEPGRHFAARFAAKEAASKAFGTGIGSSLGWRDLEIFRTDRGQPVLKLHGGGLELAAKLGVKGSHVSLTHNHSSAAAVVILLG